MPAGAADVVGRVGKKVSSSHLVECACEQLTQLAIRRRRPRPATRDIGHVIEQRVRTGANGMDHDVATSRGVDDRLFAQPARRVEAIFEDQNQRTRLVAFLKVDRQVNGIPQRGRAIGR